MAENENSQIYSDDEYAEILEKIDQLLISNQEVNILLAIELIKGFEKPTLSHLNMCLAAYFTMRDEKVNESAEEVLVKHLNPENWKTLKDAGFIGDENKDLIPFYKVNYYLLWSQIYRIIYAENNSITSILLVCEDEFFIPPEIKYLKNARSLSIKFNRTIRENDDLNPLKIFTNLHSLNLSANVFTSIQLNLFDFLSIKRLSFKNIVPIFQTFSKKYFEKVEYMRGEWNTRLFRGKKLKLNLSAFPNLTTFRYSGYGLTELNFGKQDKLERINIKSIDYKLTTLRFEFIELKSLKQLHFKGFDFSVIPKHFANLSNLEIVAFIKCNVKTFPNHLSKLPFLKSLGLPENFIEEVSTDCPSFPKLEFLYLSKNQLISFPTALGKSDKLIDLNLAENQITKITLNPDSFSNLKKLDLSKNKIKELPQLNKVISNLKRLNLTENEIESVSSDYLIHFLKKGSFFLSENKISELPQINHIESDSPKGRIYLNRNKVSNDQKSQYKIKFGNRIVI